MEKTRLSLTGNQLKIIALVTMTIDHMGLLLFPQVLLLRIVGRLSMPLYAYMIAEGCRHTHDRRRYFLRLAALALVCQAVYFLADRSLYQCILVTFSLSVLCISAVDTAREKGTPLWAIMAVAALAGAGLICEVLPRYLTGFAVDYGFFGVFLPVILYYLGKKGIIPGVVLLNFSLGGLQWWSLGAIPLMLCYNGSRGKGSLGWVFYFYYPLHLAVLYGIALLIQ